MNLGGRSTFAPRADRGSRRPGEKGQGDPPLRFSAGPASAGGRRSASSRSGTTPSTGYQRPRPVDFDDHAAQANMDAHGAEQPIGQYGGGIVRCAGRSTAPPPRPAAIGPLDRIEDGRKIRFRLRGAKPRQFRRRADRRGTDRVRKRRPRARRRRRTGPGEKPPHARGKRSARACARRTGAAFVRRRGAASRRGVRLRGRAAPARRPRRARRACARRCWPALRSRSTTASRRAAEGRPVMGCCSVGAPISSPASHPTTTPCCSGSTRSMT